MAHRVKAFVYWSWRRKFIKMGGGEMYQLWMCIFNSNLKRQECNAISTMCDV